MEIERRALKSIWSVKKQDHKLTSTHSSERDIKFRIKMDTSGYTIGGVLF